ncbi:hypothetical protein A2U01_0070133, partial [Trifolium medium]|nr:hypothetical protein [Trifolium medium]
PKKDVKEDVLTSEPKENITTETQSTEEDQEKTNGEVIQIHKKKMTQKMVIP